MFIESKISMDSFEFVASNMSLVIFSAELIELFELLAIFPPFRQLFTLFILFLDRNFSLG